MSRCWAIELQRLDAATEDLKAASSNRYDRENTSDGTTKAQRKEATCDAKKRTYDKTGERRRERIDDRLADPTTVCLVPMHVGTSDPLDRVRSSRQSLLSDCHHDCRKNEHRIHPSRPTEADNDSKPDGGRECSYSRRHS